jgi:hypothetical protein
MFNNEEQTVTQAGLFIHPITYDDFGRHQSDEEPAVPEPVEENIDVNNNFETEQIVNELSIPLNIEVQTSNENLNIHTNIDDSAIRKEEIIEKEIEDDYSDEFDAEMQKKIKEMIESVMSSAKEEADWLRLSNENIDEPVDAAEPEPIEQIEPEPAVEVTQSEEAPPLPPPRRKSTIEDSTVKTEISFESLPAIDETQIEIAAPQTQPEPESIHVEVPKHDEVDFSQLPSRLHLSSLEIDSLSVCSLTAGRITASEIDSNTIVTNELECKSSHNLTQPIEFPPGFIEEIVERVRCAQHAEQQAEPAAVEPVVAAPLQESHQNLESQPPKIDDEEAPERPPLPAQFGPTSAVPQSFYQLRDFSEDEAVHPQMPHRRRRHQNKRQESTSEEDYHRESRRNRAGTSNDQSVLALGGQFMRACGSALRDSGAQLMEILRASSKDENQRDLHIALIILIVIVAGLILMGMGDKSVHHHHWDFFNPPDNHGR